MKPDNSRYRKGHMAERLACLYLILKNYRILERRCRTPLGEIDILAAKGDTLILVEVKYRANITTALECISAKQQQRLQNAVNYVSVRYPKYTTQRWDIIALAPRRWPQHIVNAWGW